MGLRCWFAQCEWCYLGAFEQADPTLMPGTQGQRGLYQCLHCKTVSTGSATDPDGRLARISRLMERPTLGKGGGGA